MRSRPRIGLLGGSFNPAHAGHVHISREAIKRLGLSEVWWLMSPKNPLKKSSDLADIQLRVRHARALVAREPRIVIRSDEITHGIFYTVDSIRYFQKHYPRTQFVWLMGADNLKQFHRWKSSHAIMRRIAVAVIDRAPYSLSALASRTAKRYARYRLQLRARLHLVSRRAPAWMYLCIPRHPLSATILRKTLGANAFLGHNNKR